MKERNAFFSNVGLCMKLALVTLLMIGGGNFAWGDELTVNTQINSGTVNAYNPIAGSNVKDYFVKSEIIYLSSDISDLAGKNITKLTFATNQETVTWNEAEFKVFLKETNTTSYPSSGYDFIGDDGATVVYTGNLNVSSNKLEISLSKPFTYNSGNLLLGVYCTKKSTNNSNVQFKGVSNYGAYLCLYNATGSTVRNAIRPQTTFTYEVPVLSILSISPDEEANFGTVWANATKDYVITNNSGSTVNVVPTITGTDAALFSVLPNNADIKSGQTQTFTLSFNYNNSYLDSRTASITFTPNEDSENAITKNITANVISDNAPELSVTPGNTNLGTVYSGDVTYTVTNTGTGSLSVNIASDNSDFVLDKTSISGLAHGESDTFTVTYTFAGTLSKLGENGATITITPTYDAGDAKAYAVTATSNPTMTLDEDSPTTINYGTKDYLLVKYTPSDGWNSISMPFVLRNSTNDYMTPIFGEGWKAYTLLSYSDGTLRFSKVSDKANIYNATPYLVYVSSAASHANGVLLTDIYTNGNTSSSSSNNGATFQGTYVTKTYNALTDEASPWYGVTPAGKVMKAGTGAAIKGYRAYFTGVSAPAGARVSIVIEGDDETTDLGFVKMVDENATDVYTLSGQKVKKGNKGIYIVNGRKVVIK